MQTHAPYGTSRILLAGEAAPGLPSLSAPLAAARHIAGYLEIRLARLAILRALKHTCSCLFGDAAQQFVTQFVALEEAGKIPMLTSQLTNVTAVRLDAFGIGESTRSHPTSVRPSVERSFLNMCPPDGFQALLTIPTAEMAYLATPRLLGEAVETVIRKLNRFIISLAKQRTEEQRDQFLVEQRLTPPLLCLPCAMNSFETWESGEAQKQVELSLIFIGLEHERIRTIENDVRVSHLGEVSDPGAGGCDLRRQAIASAVVDFLPPYIEGYIRALDFKVLMLEGTLPQLRQDGLIKDQVISVEFPFDHDVVLGELTRSVTERMRKLNEELKTAGIAFEFQENPEIGLMARKNESGEYKKYGNAKIRVNF